MFVKCVSVFKIKKIARKVVTMDSVGKTEIIMCGGNLALTLALSYYFNNRLSDLEAQIQNLNGKLADTIRFSSQTEEMAKQFGPKITSLSNEFKNMATYVAALNENDKKSLKVVGNQGKAIMEIQEFLKSEKIGELIGGEIQFVYVIKRDKPKKRNIKRKKKSKGKNKKNVSSSEESESSDDTSDSSDSSDEDPDDILKEMSKIKKKE